MTIVKSRAGGHGLLGPIENRQSRAGVGWLMGQEPHFSAKYVAAAIVADPGQLLFAMSPRVFLNARMQLNSQP